jgi:hypothetical protein
MEEDYFAIQELMRYVGSVDSERQLKTESK